MKNEIKIENSKASITVSNFKCVEDAYPGDPKIHVSFDVCFESHEYKFSTNFSEMVFCQFDFKKGINQIVDEMLQEKRLVIDKDKITLQVEQDPDELSDMQLRFTLKADPDKIDDFKIELNAYVDYLLKG